MGTHDVDINESKSKKFINDGFRTINVGGKRNSSLGSLSDVEIANTRGYTITAAIAKRNRASATSPPTERESRLFINGLRIFLTLPDAAAITRTLPFL